MEARNFNYIPPISLTLNQNLPPPPPPSTITNPTPTIHHQQMQFLVSENQQRSNELSAALQDLRHLSETAVKVKAEVRGVLDRAVTMEAEVKLVDGLNGELGKVLCEVWKMRLEKRELEEELKKVRGEVLKVLEEWNWIRVMESEIGMMKKEIERGRELIEHEKRVHACNIKQSQSMEGYKILLAGEIKRLLVEVADAGKRARAAAAAEAASIRVVF